MQGIGSLYKRTCECTVYGSMREAWEWTEEAIQCTVDI